MWKVESFLKYRKITLCWQIHHELGDKVMKVLSEHIVVSDLSFYLSYYQPTYLQWKNGMGWRHIRFRIVHFLDVVEFLKPKNCLSYNNYQCNCNYCDNKNVLGSGCGAAARAVTSDTRGPRFESSHRQNLYGLSTLLKRRK